MKGGFVVHVGSGDGVLTAQLRAGDRYVVRGLDRDANCVRTAREHIQSQGLYGPVSVALLEGERLPPIDNLVDLLVVSAPDRAVTGPEVRRVLTPLGVAVVKGGLKAFDGLEERGEAHGFAMYAKPWPKQIDEWPQYQHGPDNNGVAHDSVVGPPRHFQWADEPRWMRSHMTTPSVCTMVSARGRLFIIEDIASVENPMLPGRWRLTARNAFNGVLLWTHDFSNWEPITRFCKNVAVQPQRRLLVDGDTVYCTPGLEAPVTAFDAATGKVLKNYPGTERTQEFAFDRGVLYLVVGDRMSHEGPHPGQWMATVSAAYDAEGYARRAPEIPSFREIARKGTPLGGLEFDKGYAPEPEQKQKTVCKIIALQAESGEEVWRSADLENYIGGTLSVRGRYAALQTASALICLARDTGQELWRVTRPANSRDGCAPNTLVLTDTHVYATYGTGQKKGASANLVAFSIEDGAENWQASCGHQYRNPPPIYHVDGVIWTGGSQEEIRGHDAQTGEPRGVLCKIDRGRCYRAVVTNRYYIDYKGHTTVFLSFGGKELTEVPWIRGTCGFGLLPCNGLLYTTPFSCTCGEVGGRAIQGLQALYSGPMPAWADHATEVARTARLVKGPAYGEESGGTGQESEGDWPTYRGDAQRSGSTDAPGPARPQTRWTTRLPAKPSAPVIADGHVFVAAVDQHTLYALDADSGEKRWTYTAGGRIDSPPTYHNGLVLFGSRDGWVHSLRAGDGALVWRFKDLPDKTVFDHGQPESAWPVCGSVLLHDGKANFSAGRCPFLDGGLFVYRLDPETGACVNSRRVDTNTGPQTSAILSAASAIRPSPGFLDAAPHHRTNWYYTKHQSGDIMVMSGKDLYAVQGYAVGRVSFFDVRVKGYQLVAQTAGQRGKARWSVGIPITGRAMALARDALYVAGNPAYFPPDHDVKKYEAGYRGDLGGLLLSVSPADGKTLSEVKLDAPPVWDGLAVAGGQVYLSLSDGSVLCLEDE